MTPEEKLAEMGLAVPEVAKPVAAYVPAVRSGSHVFTSGQLPMREGQLLLEKSAKPSRSGRRCAPGSTSSSPLARSLSARAQGRATTRMRQPVRRRASRTVSS